MQDTPIGTFVHTLHDEGRDYYLPERPEALSRITAGVDERALVRHESDRVWGDFTSRAILDKIGSAGTLGVGARRHTLVAPRSR